MRRFFLGAASHRFALLLTAIRSCPNSIDDRESLRTYPTCFCSLPSVDFNLVHFGQRQGKCRTSDGP